MYKLQFSLTFIDTIITKCFNVSPCRVWCYFQAGFNWFYWQPVCAWCRCSDKSADRRVVFAHQSCWQQMLLRHGCEVCVTDTTQNTIAYVLLLFQMCVPTNCAMSLLLRSCWPMNRQIALRSGCAKLLNGVQSGSEWVTEQLLNGTSAHYRLFSATNGG